MGWHYYRASMNLSSAQLLLQRMIMLLKGRMGVQVVVLLFDRYDTPNSIKCQKRILRGADESASHLTTANQVLPHCQNFLKSSSNKAALAVFIFEFIMERAPAMLAGDQSITLAGGFRDGKKSVLITEYQTRDLGNLSCTQEEADTRMLTHAVDISESDQFVQMLQMCWSLWSTTMVRISCLFWSTCTNKQNVSFQYMKTWPHHVSSFANHSHTKQL